MRLIYSKASLTAPLSQKRYIKKKKKDRTNLFINKHAFFYKYKRRKTLSIGYKPYHILSKMPNARLVNFLWTWEPLYGTMPAQHFFVKKQKLTRAAFFYVFFTRLVVSQKAFSEKADGWHRTLFCEKKEGLPDLIKTSAIPLVQQNDDRV